MCKHNPPAAQPTYKGEKADLIYKCVFGDFTSCVHPYIYDIKASTLATALPGCLVSLLPVMFHCHAACIGHGPIRTLFLSLIFFSGAKYVCHLTFYYTVWPEWGATYASGLESTRVQYALEQRYNLPLDPPPPHRCSFAEIQVQICVSLVT